MTTPVVLQGGGTSVVLQRPQTPVVLVRGGKTAVVAPRRATTVVVAVARQGPPGVIPGGALAAANYLSEFDDETKRAQARANLGLQTIDGGTFN